MDMERMYLTFQSKFSNTAANLSPGGIDCGQSYSP
jgi:hypothetical protein